MAQGRCLGFGAIGAGEIEIASDKGGKTDGIDSSDDEDSRFHLIELSQVYAERKMAWTPTGLRESMRLRSR
jgi:hypothetical protein